MEKLEVVLRLKIRLFALLFLCFFSCSEKKTVPISLSPEVVSKNFHTGNSLGQFYFFNQVRNDSLLVFNVYDHALNIIDTRVDSVVSSIQFEFNGPNAVNEISSFYYHNEDSIFLAENNQAIVLITSRGELKRRYSDFESSFETDEREKVYENNPSLRFASQLLYNSEEYEIFLYLMSFNQPEKKRIFASYSLKTGKSKSIPIYYPEDYLGKKLDLSKLFLTSATLDGNGFAYIFSGSPRIFRYDFHSSSVNSLEAIPPWKKVKADDIPFGPMNTSEKQLFMAENPFYYKIYYDHYRDVYYRLSSPPRPNSIEADFHYVNYNRILVSVLDSQLNLISDFYLPKENTYNVGFSFVTSEGLWISYNSKNQDDENFIKGDLIRIKELF
ncbi:DUF4221 family protein [uncultured Algoriphagus sp.]|uniref:DUF4221 family protein n=1 Tax=uncultured Algoriphagus sp. TaxID=417365 RepID=UPI00258899FC|nr:DUF4221 family protein [uncultured Algoriphagus sp.]